MTTSALADTLRDAVAEVVRHQNELGIDIPGDGEFGKPMGQRVNYGSWWRYSWQRLGGLEPAIDPALRHAAAPLQPWRDRADQLWRPPRPPAVRRGLRRSRFRHHHRAAAAGADLRRPAHLYRPRRDPGRHRQLQSGHGGGRGRGRLHDRGRAGAAASRIGNEYYKTDEEFLYACADAMREEYKAIVDAGLVLQLDDPASPRTGTRSTPSRRSRTTRNSRCSGSRRSTTRSSGLPAGPHPLSSVLGQLARPAHRPTSRCATSSRSCWRSTARPIRSRPAMSATSTSGRSGRTSNCPTTS